MKHLLTLVAVFTFAFTITSCGDPCKDTVCLNGGYCSLANCVCPVNYEGALCQIYNPCQTTQCLNNGECVNGVCECPTGYEGDSCHVRTTLKFVGSYSGNSDCTQDNQDVFPTFSITQSQQTFDKLFINGNITAFVTNSNSFKVPSQVYDLGIKLVVVSGFGELVNNNLNVTMSVSDSLGTGATCNYSLSRN